MRIPPYTGVAAALLCAAAPAVAQGDSWHAIHLWGGNGVQSDVGTAVAGAGDLDADGYDDVVVGVPGGSPGFVRVYSGRTGGLLYALYAPTGASGVGTAVAVVEDLNGDGADDLLVGAPYSHLGGLTYNGAAFLYSGADGALLRTFLGPADFDQLGNSVAAAGDVDGDGVCDLLIGASQAANTAGSAFVHSGATGLLLHRIWGAIAGDELGMSVAGAGDLDLDGRMDLLVGVPGADPGGRSRAGEVHVYSGSSGARLRSFDGSLATDELGTTVACLGDIDGDSVPDYALGAPEAKRGFLAQRGEVSLRSGASGAVLHTWTGFDDFDRLGDALAPAGDIDGDGVTDLLVGAPGAGPGGNNEPGQASVFSAVSGALVRRFTGEDAFDGFGTAVAAAGDVDGDGRADLVIGAPRAFPAGSGPYGAAYVLGRLVDGPGPYTWRWSPVNGHWYTLLQGVDWATAAATAAQYPRVELATVRDLDEQLWIYHSLMGGVGLAYMGLNDAQQEGVYVWSSGETTPWWGAHGYFGLGGVPGFWYPGEPNNFNNEDYCTLGRPSGAPGDGEWNDGAGVAQFRAVLEWMPDSGPELQVQGSCPGAVSLSCTGLQPGAPLAVIYGLSGQSQVLAGPCGAMQLPLANPRLLGIYTATPQGTVSFLGQAPPGACGNLDVLALELPTCLKSNTVFL